MKIAIDISPLSSGHKVRGVGFYLHHLKNGLEKYFPENQYTYFTKQEEIPNNVDLVHYPYFDPFFISLPLLKKHKTVVTVHDLTPIVFPNFFPSGMKGRIKWEINKKLLKQADLVITDSNISTSDVIRLVRVDKRKVHTIYLAAGEEFQRIKAQESRMKGIKKKYHLPNAFALYVGDVTWNKNVPSIVEAASQANIPLVMVGKALAENKFDRANPWNADKVKVEALVKNNSLVWILGFIPTEDVVALYNAATVFIMPSLYEGFGLPILEAMACGCPVITSKLGSLPEVAREAAYYVDPYSIEGIKKGIQVVWQDKTVQKELEKKGLDRASEFSWKKTAEQTITAYKSIL